MSVRVAAPPVEGAANAALLTLLSMQLAVRGSDLAIVSGATSRRKVIRIYGDGQQIACRLRHIAGAA